MLGNLNVKSLRVLERTNSVIIKILETKVCVAEGTLYVTVYKYFSQ
jgi:hypothetical protein